MFSLIRSFRPTAPSILSPMSVRWRTFGTEYQPNNLKKKKKFGFMKRLKTWTGRLILKRRMLKELLQIDFLRVYYRVMIWAWIYVCYFLYFPLLLSSIIIPSEPCSDCLYPISELGAIKLSNMSLVLVAGGSDSFGYLESNFKLLDYLDLNVSFFRGENQPLQMNNILEGFQSPILCMYDSIIIFMDLSNDPPNMFELDLTSWSWNNSTFYGIPPPARQRYGKACSEYKIYIHSGITFKTVQDDFGFWEYDIISKTWSVLPNVPFLWGHSIAVLGMELFALGGNTLEQEVTVPNTNIWKYDINDQKWDIIYTKFYGGGTITPLNDSLIVYGGHVSSSFSGFEKKGWVLTRLFQNKSGWKTEFINQKESFKYSRQGHASVYDKDLNLIINLGGQAQGEEEGNYTFVSIFNMTSLMFL